MNTIDNPFASPPVSYPPATVRWKYYSTTVPGGADEWVVPWQPGTPLGLLVPVVWQVTDIFFRVDTPSAAGQSTLQIARYTGTGNFANSNYINMNPIVIPINANECTGRPFTLATINAPLVNSGDKLQPVISLGAGAALVSFYVTLTQYPGV